MKLLVLGASGSVGRRIVEQGVARGHEITAQTRDASKLQSIPAGVHVAAADPRDTGALAALVAGQDAVIFALGAGGTGPTTLFSDVTKSLITAMREKGVRRLVAITGVGAGETRGHGGFVYDWIIFPLFTRHIYSDKNRQEELIRASDLDWVILRPAPFNDAPASTPFQAVAEVGPGTVLRRIARDEVACFALDQLEKDDFLRKSVFFGHA